MQVNNPTTTAAGPANPKKAAGVHAKAKPAAPAQAKAPEEKDWTVLCYLDGHNDLEKYVAKSMLELEQVGSDKNVNVVAQLGRLPQEKAREVADENEREYKPTNIDGDWGGVRRYYVTNSAEAAEAASDAKAPKGKPTEKDLMAMFASILSGEGEGSTEIKSKVVQDLGDTDMSKGTTLADFLIWGMKTYPAKHYLVSLFDHGGGWRGAFTDDASGQGGKIMEASEIAAALKLASAANGGKKIDNVDMVACLMASSEMAYQMRDSTKFMSASEEMGTTEAFHYAPIIQELQAASAEGKPLEPKELAEFLVNHYQDKPEAFETKSSIDLEKMDAVKQAIDGLATALNKTKMKPDEMKAAIDRSQQMARVEPYPFYDQFRDLSGLAEQLSGDSIKDEAVKKAARKVMKAVDGAVVANLAHEYQRQEVLNQGVSADGKEMETIVKVTNGKFDTHGLTIYAPIEKKYTSERLMEPYSELSLSKDTGWDEFITKLNETPTTKSSKADGKAHPAPVPKENAA